MSSMDIPRTYRHAADSKDVHVDEIRPRLMSFASVATATSTSGVGDETETD